MMWSPLVKRGIALEIHEDGHITLQVRSRFANDVFNSVVEGGRRGKGRRINTWWLFNSDWSPHINFKAGAEEAAAVGLSLKMLLDAIETDAQQYSLDRINLAEPGLRVRLAELELELARLKERIGE